MSLPLRRFAGQAFRGHHPRWAFAPESGDGAKRHGGRFNPKGVPALYLSLSPKTAWLEAQQGFAFKAQPLTLCCYEIDCDDILDLTETPARLSAETSFEDLGCAWEEIASRRKTPPSWDVAERLRNAGCAGIIIPSFANRAQGDDINLVLWNWSRDPPHSVRVVDDDQRLPKSDLSWR